jgi:hypothetical protein
MHATMPAPAVTGQPNENYAVLNRWTDTAGIVWVTAVGATSGRTVTFCYAVA